METLRAATYNPSTDINGCNLIKRYYCQLHSLQNRFPIENDHHLVSFNWRDIYSNNSTQSTDLKHDMAVVLYNYGALHTVLGAAMSRATEEEMKLACTHFQCSAWAFETIREKYGMATTGDMCPEILIFMQQISFAQAQECILEKSLIDNRKSIIVAKVTAQIIEYYNTALAALLTGGEDGIVSEVVGSKLFKEWKQYVQFKVQYMTCILLLYQGQHAEEQQKMGERVALYQTAFDRLEEARKESRGMNNAPAIAEALAFVMDVVEAKRKSARNENEFIYHEEVPELSSISSVPAANLVKGIAFSVTDPTLLGEDIFHRLVPIKAHETSSLYSEEKAALLRHIGQQIEAKDTELKKFMESLNIDSLNYDASDVRLPQSLIDRCADLNAKPNAIPDLISKMSSLAEICVDVENMLGNIQELLSKEEFHEKDFQQTMGYRPSSHFIELNREFMKYQEAHSKAGGSNDTLRKAMELHVNNLKILARPLADVQAAIPICGAEINPNALNETRNLLNKVNEMQMQRAQLYSQLNDDIQKDDITAQLIAWGDKNVEQLFKTELAKHEKLTAIIEQNLIAQGNILKAFTDAYAKCAHFIKAVADTKHKRETFFSSLIASYDVYDDLLGKSLKGLEFYKKLQSNIHKLSARVRSACDVNEEERQQRIESLNKKVANANANVVPQSKPPQPPNQPTLTSMAPHSSSVGIAPLPTSNQDIAASMPKLSDYEKYESYRNSSIRPTPIGQENTAISSTCLTSITGSVAYDAKQIVPNATHASNTPYNYAAATSVSYAMPTSDAYNVSNYAAPATSQFKGTHTGYDMSGANNAGYVNPMYSNFPSSAPPTYTPAYYSTDEQSGNASYTHPPAAKHVETSNYRPPTQPSPAPSPQSFDGRVSYANYQPSESTTHPSNVYSTMQYVHPAEPPLPTYSANTAAYHDQQQYQTYAQYPSSLPNSQANTSVSYPQASMSSYSYAEPNYSTSQQQPNSSANNSTYNYATVYSQPQQQQHTQYIGFHQPMPTSTNVPTDQMNAIQNDPAAYGVGNVYYNQNVAGNAQPYLSQPSYPAASGSNQYYTDTVSAQTPQMANIQYQMPTDNANYTNVNYNPNLSNANYNYNYNSTHSADQTYSAPSSQPNYATSTNVIPNPAPASTIQPSQQPQPQQSVQAKPKSKIDLLSDMENISIAAPTLQPIKSESILLPTKKDEPATTPAEPPAAVKPVGATTVSSEPSSAVAAATTTTSISTVTSLESELSQLSMIDSFSKFEPAITKSNASSTTDLSTPMTVSATSTAPINIEAFFKEVQRYEKVVNNLQTKTLNGTTSLAIKWKDLNDLLVSVDLWDRQQT